MTDAVEELAPAAGVRGARAGFAAVAVGLGVYGLATFAFLALAGQALGPERFAPLSVLWTLLNAVGIGLFLPFEQELARTGAARRARGEGAGPVARRVALLAVGTVAASAVVTALAAGPATERLLHGRADLLVLLVLGLAGLALTYVARGLLSGAARFGRYGGQLAADGVLRVAGAAALAAAGVTDVRAFGIVLVAAPVAAVLVTTPRPAALAPPGPPAPPGVAAALGVLLAAAVGSQLLANAGPLVVQLLAEPAERVATGQFLAALVVARVPVFAFAAVQAVLLPGLAALVGAGDTAGFRRRLGLVTAVTAGLGALGTVGVALWGPALVRALFGPGFDVGRGVVTLVAVSGALFMLAQLAAQALLALGRDAAVVTGWCAGLAALVAACVAPGPAVRVAAVALVVGSAAAVLVLGAALATGTRGPLGARRPEASRA